MTTTRIAGAILMVLGVLFFFIYLWWAHAHLNSEGGWGIGIWLVAVGVFVIGSVTFFTKDIYDER